MDAQLAPETPSSRVIDLPDVSTAWTVRNLHIFIACGSKGGPISRKKDGDVNPRGIPYAPFVDKVEDYVSSRAEVDGTMKNFQELIAYVPSDSILRWARLTPVQEIPIHGSQHSAAQSRAG